MRGLFIRRTYPVLYTVTFNGNGGSSDATQVKTGLSHKLDYLPTATRDGHTFNGWFTAAEGGTQITTDTVFTGDITVYAQWTAVAYTITVTGTGKSNRASLFIPSDNNRRVTSATTLSITPGDYIRCEVAQDASFSAQRSRIYLNGTAVATTSTNTPSKRYDYYPTGDATITLSVAANGYTGTITITEE